MTHPSPALALHGIGLRIGAATILDGVDLTVDTGSMVGIIGPNGAGKTTLFNVVSGLARPTTGSVELDGRDITGLSVQRRARAGLGRTFQTLSLIH
ncbi:UNVERIFIED_CONTAM: branched-chain amino acid ABC transporter substrate-binding protein, partial [Mumia flava]